MPIDVDSLEGQTVEFLTSIILPTDWRHEWDPISTPFQRGDRLTLTAENIDASRKSDRFGISFYELLDDEEGQRQRWGRPVFRRGTEVAIDPWESVSDASYANAYREAARAVRALPAGPERQAAQVAFARRFPQAPSDDQQLIRYLR